VKRTRSTGTVSLQGLVHPTGSWRVSARDGQFCCRTPAQTAELLWVARPSQLPFQAAKPPHPPPNPKVGDLLATAAERHLLVGGSATGVWLRCLPPADSLRLSSQGDHPPPPAQQIRQADLRSDGRVWAAPRVYPIKPGTPKWASKRPS